MNRIELFAKRRVEGGRERKRGREVSMRLSVIKFVVLLGRLQLISSRCWGRQMDWFMMMPLILALPPSPPRSLVAALGLTRHDIINCPCPASYRNDDRHNLLAPALSLFLFLFLCLSHMTLFHLQQIWKLIWKTFDSWLSRISQCVIYIYIYYLIFLLLCTSSFSFAFLFALLRFALFTLDCCRCRCRCVCLL